MPICYRKVGNKYYSPSQFKKLKQRSHSISKRGRQYTHCPRCCRNRTCDENYACRRCGYAYWQGE